jgi:hypothetical protein
MSSFSAKSFLKTYGTVGVTVYGSVTAVSMTSIYWAVRTTMTTTNNDDGDFLDEATLQTKILTPMEKVFGSDSQLIQSIRQQLQNVIVASSTTTTATATPTTTVAKENDNDADKDPTIASTKSTGTTAGNSTSTTSTTTTSTIISTINWKREGAYFGVATLVDSLILPIKLLVCLPIAKYILKRRGGGGGRGGR